MENIVFNEDCLGGMKRFPDGFFDLAVCDPPYFSGPNTRKYYGRSISSTRIQRGEYPVLRNWETPTQEYFLELSRVSKKWIVWGCNYYEHLFPSGRIVWDKCNGGASFSDCEIAATNCHDSVRLFRYMWNGMCQGVDIAHGEIMQGNKKKNEKRIHPTQKPVALYEWILAKYAAPGMKILDSHVGSGSSRIAAYRANLDFYGFEIDPVMFELQERRFEDETSQVRFDQI